MMSDRIEVVLAGLILVNWYDLLMEFFDTGYWVMLLYWVMGFF